MKTVRKDKDVRRVSDVVASQLIKKGFKYCPKWDYKTEVQGRTPPEKG